MTPTPAWIDAEAEGIDIATACETLRKVAEGRLLLVDIATACETLRKVAEGRLLLATQTPVATPQLGAEPPADTTNYS